MSEVKYQQQARPDPASGAYRPPGEDPAHRPARPGGFLAGLGDALSGGRMRRLEAENNRLSMLVAALPDEWAGWNDTGDLIASPGFAALLGLEHFTTLEDVEGALAPGDAAALHGLYSRLEATGASFEIAASLATGNRVVQIRGTRASAAGTAPAHKPDANGAASPHGEAFIILWLRDITASVRATGQAITARQAAEAEAGSLRRLMDLLPLPLWIRRADFSIEWLNRAAARVVETGPDEALSEQREPGAGSFGRDGRDVARKARAKGQAASDEAHLVIEGTRHFVELGEIPAGEDGRMIGYMRERTAEQDLRTELERNLSAHASMLEELHVAVAIYSQDTRLAFFNSAYARLWGLEARFLESKPTYGELLEALRDRRRLPEQADFRRYKAGQLGLFTDLIETSEDLDYLPDGTTLRTLTVPHPMGGVMFIHEDVTSRLQLESSFRTLTAVQRETLANLAEGIAVFGEDGRLKLSNRAFSEIWDFRPEQLENEPHVTAIASQMAKSIGGDAENQHASLIANALDRTPHDGTMQLADGRFIEFAVVPLPDGDVLNRFFDVTDSHRIEQALRERTDALEAADRLKLEFLANVSYQLRTPLNAIMGFAEILDNGLFGELDERQKEYSAGIMDAGDRLLALINNILDVTSIEAGYLELDPHQVEVATLVAQVVDLTESWVQQRSLRLEHKVAADAGSFEGDDARIKQVLLNLMTNAMKFTPAGGIIRLEAQRACNAAGHDGVLLVVSDTGIGIPDEDRERVFGTFERAHPKMGHSGAGLGLSLVRSLVEMHGGYVRLETGPDKGTRVECWLPATVSADAQASNAA